MRLIDMMAYKLTLKEIRTLLEAKKYKSSIMDILKSDTLDNILAEHTAVDFCEGYMHIRSDYDNGIPFNYCGDKELKTIWTRGELIAFIKVAIMFARIKEHFDLKRGT